jgi:hypothetical protein
MTAPPADLKLFFTDDASRPVLDACDPAQTMRALKDAAGAMPSPCWDALKGASGRLVDELFQVPLEDVLASGWNTIGAYGEAMKASRADAGRIFPLLLADHVLASSHEPYVEVDWGPKSVCKIHFLISLELELKGIQLEIRAGRIEAVDAGSCKGSAVFGLGQTELLRRSTPEFRLPGKVRFGSSAAS